MQKVFIGIVICCLFTMQSRGQQQQANLSLKSIRKNVDNLLRYGKLNTACSVVIEKYKNSLPGNGNNDLDAKAVQQLVAANSDFATAAGSAAFKARCNYKLINQLIDSVHHLDKQLKGLGVKKTEIAGKEAKVSTEVRNMTIGIMDDSLESPVDADVRIDSLDDTTTYLRKAGDSIGYFYAALIAGKTYRLTAAASGYKPVEQELIAASDAKPQTATIRLSPELKMPDASSKRPAAPETLMEYVERRFRNFTILFVLISLVSLILGALNLLLVYRMYKKHGESANKQPTAMTDDETMQPDESAGDTGTANDHPAAVTSAPGPLGENIPAPVPASVAAPASRYFLSEILITAGPRKKSMSDPDADKDLGEDICGFVSNGQQLFLWLLDGTSDLHCLKNPEDKREYFSSRLLAQGIANRLRASFLSKDGKALDQLILQAIQEVQKAWLTAIEKLPAAEKDILRLNIEKKNIPECATTLLIGQLSINGDITAYRSGDSKMFLFDSAGDTGISFKETSLSDKNDDANDRVFFRLVLGPDGAFDILFNVPKYEIVNERNINTLIVFSDGIGAATETLIKKQYSGDADKIREEIIYQAQGTADDKSICFVEIRQ